MKVGGKGCSILPPAGRCMYDWPNNSSQSYTRTQRQPHTCQTKNTFTCIHTFTRKPSNTTQRIFSVISRPVHHDHHVHYDHHDQHDQHNQHCWRFWWVPQFSPCRPCPPWPSQAGAQGVRLVLYQVYCNPGVNIKILAIHCRESVLVPQSWLDSQLPSLISLFIFV